MIKNKYYDEIDKALKSYEEKKPYHLKTIDWVCDRISWCWQWKKITEEEMKELADRATKCIKEGL